MGAKMTALRQCAFGLKTKDDRGNVVAAKKPTILLSNMPAVHCVMGVKRDGSHDHGKSEVHDARMLRCIPRSSAMPFSEQSDFRTGGTAVAFEYSGT